MGVLITLGEVDETNRTLYLLWPNKVIYKYILGRSSTRNKMCVKKCRTFVAWQHAGPGPVCQSA